MSLLNFILLFVFFGFIISFGYQFARRILRENKLIFLIPFSLCIGSAFFTTLLHLLSLLLGVKASTYFSLGIIIASIFFILKHKSNSPLTIGISKVQFFILIFFSLFLSILSLNYLLKFNTYDPGVYQLIGIITKGEKYPTLNPYGPEISLVYHNGVALFASGLKIFSNLETLDSLFPIQVLFIFIFPIIIFIFLHSLTKSFIMSFFGSLIGCFCATLRSLKLLIIPLPGILNEFLLDPHKTLFWMADSGLVSPTQKALISPNLTIALPLAIFLFFISTKEDLDKKYYLPILLTSAFLFFSYEAYWIPTTIAIVLYHTFLIIQKNLNKEQILKTVFMILLFLSSTILVQGVFQNKNENITKLVSLEIKPYAFTFTGTLHYTYPTRSWFKRNEVICHANGNRFYKVPFLSKYFFNEFGLPLVTLPFVLKWLIKSNNLKLLFFLFSGVLSFIIPFLITYHIIQIETIRFFIYSRVVFSILFGTFLGYLLTIKTSPLFKKVFLCLTIFLLTLILIIPGIVWLIPKTLKQEYRFNLTNKTDKIALGWLSKNSRSGDIGIGPWDIPFKYVELITFAGVYGCGVHIQNLAQEQTRANALRTLNPCLLEELKVRWIYLNQKLLHLIPKNTLNYLLKEKILQERFKYKNKKDLRIIYEFIPPKNNRYCYKKNYKWAIGRLIEGNFIPIKSEFQSSFPTKKMAIKNLNKLKKLLYENEAILYGVEVIKA